MKLFGFHTSPPTPTVPPPSQGDGAADPAFAPEPELAEMSFLDHLEELRWAIFKALGGLLGAVIVCTFFGTWIIDTLLMGPARSDFFMYSVLGLDAQTLNLQNRTITGQFFAHIGTIVAAGFVIGSPIVVYFLWKFIEPGLYPEERSGLRFSAVFATFFFILGITFGYLIITPVGLHFFANYIISDQIENIFDITRYFSMVTWWAFGTGILFELPVVIYFLTKLGVVTPEVLRASRKYALIGILILGALFTPPDPVSQMLVAIPLLLLYEGSIYVSAWALRRRKRQLEKALS